jgi:hypothetical protein
MRFAMVATALARAPCAARRAATAPSVDLDRTTLRLRLRALSIASRRC